jgi:hypothetical protein
VQLPQDLASNYVEKLHPFVLAVGQELSYRDAFQELHHLIGQRPACVDGAKGKEVRHRDSGTG